MGQTDTRSLSWCTPHGPQLVLFLSTIVWSPVLIYCPHLPAPIFISFQPWPRSFTKHTVKWFTFVGITFVVLRVHIFVNSKVVYTHNITWNLRSLKFWVPDLAKWLKLHENYSVPHILLNQQSPFCLIAT